MRKPFAGCKAVLTVAAPVLALTATLIHPSTVARAESSLLPKNQPPFLEIRHSKRARVVFSDGRRQLWLEDAELAWGELGLTVGEARLDTARGAGELGGGVVLTGPDITVRSERCTVDTRGGELAFPKPLEVRRHEEGLSLRANEGRFYYIPDTGEAHKAVLSGDVVASWERGVSLNAPKVVYLFRSRVLQMTEGFTTTVAGSFLPPSSQGLAGGGVELQGRQLFAQIEGAESAPDAVSLSASGVTLRSEALSLSAPTLTARLKMPARGEPSAQVEVMLLQLTGGASSPVSGVWLREDGREVALSAQKVEKPSLEDMLRFQGAVHLSSEELDLSAPVVELHREDDAFRVEIPQRFRLTFQREFIAGLQGSRSSPPDS